MIVGLSRSKLTRDYYSLSPARKSCCIFVADFYDRYSVNIPIFKTGFASPQIVLQVILKKTFPTVFQTHLCCNIATQFSPGGGIGRRSRLKICRPQGCAGSIPVLGTRKK
jgi:hypothetical protein